MSFIKNQILVCITILSLNLYSSILWAMDVPIEDFPIAAYSQNAHDYLSQDDANPLLNPSDQALRLKQFYRHYYASNASSLSPWGEQLITAMLPIVKHAQPYLIEEFNNENKPAAKKHYGENFKEHDQRWGLKIKQNMDLPAIEAAAYDIHHRAIAVANTAARVLPTSAPDFYHASIPGEGFPFDNLQESAIWVGTPLYVVSTSTDKAWSLVLTPDLYFAWVKSEDIAYASPLFVHQWQSIAQQNLIAVTKTEATVLSPQNQFMFTGYIGSVFPFSSRIGNETYIFVPGKNRNNQATIMRGKMSSKDATMMPMPASKENMAKLFGQLQNRPYGWGGAFFFNDCSQELKSLFAPFGIWLPRNSALQARLSPELDLSPEPMEQRLDDLKTRGHPLMTLIYIGGHVMLYVGNAPTSSTELTPITYQNVWGLSPASKDKRYVIGQSLFLPLLRYYPENPDAISLANKSYFKLIFLDGTPQEPSLTELIAPLAKKFIGSSVSQS